MIECISDEEIAGISVRGVCFSYSKSLILNGISLTVPKATVYALLGSSGCGKTTLLRCLLGRLEPSGGQISIFGEKVGSDLIQIPGAGVGYMPQDLGLSIDLTIGETLVYFGRIFGIENNKLDEQISTTIKLLQLPSKAQLIGKLSGGQQRRVSLASALLHSPPLLILDEPTVGVDPLLRQTIWRHLKSLCKLGLTIIMTTHYIEEARSAHVIGFMRNGRLLAENNAECLLKMYETTNLENIFLKLCRVETEETLKKFTDNEETVENNENNNNNNIDNKTIESDKLVSIISDDLIVENSSTRGRLRTSGYSSKSQHETDYDNQYLIQKNPPVLRAKFTDKLLALICKTTQQFSRNIGQVLTYILLPSMLLSLVLISIGDGPTGITIAVFDNESLVNDYNSNERWGYLLTDCLNDSVFIRQEYQSYDEAYNSVVSGKSYAMLFIRETFTENLRLRQRYFEESGHHSISQSPISVYVDRSNPIVGEYVEYLVFNAVLKFAEVVANKTNVSPETFKLPLVFEEPVYGHRSLSIRDILVTSLYLLMPCYTMASITSVFAINDINSGLTERTLIAGVAIFEFLLSITVTQLAILCAQTLIVMAVQPIVFGLPYRGSLSLLTSLTLSQGLYGITMGLVLSATCPDSGYAVLFAITVFFVSIVMGGMISPIENMPRYFRLVSYLAPQTLPIQAMRSIELRQFGFDHFQVYIGFAVTYVWSMVYAVVAFVCLKRRL